MTPLNALLLDLIENLEQFILRLHGHVPQAGAQLVNEISDLSVPGIVQETGGTGHAELCSKLYTVGSGRQRTYDMDPARE